MVNEEPTAVQDTVEGLERDLDPELLGEESLEPEIVVSRKVGHSHAAVTEFSEGTQKPYVTPRYDRRILEPIVEQIPHDEHVFRP